MVLFRWPAIWLQCIIFYPLLVCSEVPKTTNMDVMAAAPQDDAPAPRVEDFFWTGSGDGPPAPAAPARPAPSAPTTLVRTTTVLATLYLDHSQPPQAVTDRTTGDCILNCDSGGFPDSLQPEEATVPGDRRYWLLTVVRGGTPDALQLRLARLYQKAFLRQQERHLGIVKSLDAPTTRKKHEVHSFGVGSSNVSQNGSPQRYHNVQGSMMTPPVLTTRTSDSTPDLNVTSSFSISLSSIAPSMTQFLVNVSEPETMAHIVATQLSEVEDMWFLATTDASLVKREIVADHEDMIDDDTSEKMLDISLEEETNSTSGVFKREIIKPEQQAPVKVYIQNVTESPETQSVEIVYVVTVGGRAVPAAVAARDMRLVRDAEVASELGYPVTTKAEPYLKAAEGLEGRAGPAGGGEVWALAGGAVAAAVLLILLLALLCRLVRRRKALSAGALHSYRSELMRQAERSQVKRVHEEKDGRLISVVSPSRTRPSSAVLPRHRDDTSSSSSTSSGVSEMAAAALRRRQRRELRAAQRATLRPHKRVGTTDSLLVSAGLSDSSESARVPSPATPTSYLSMPSVKSFPRGNAVEPLTRVLEPVSVRHLDLDSPLSSPKHPPAKPQRKPASERGTEAVPRRQMASQLVRLGSMDKDPGVIGPLVWDLHCQRVKEMPKRVESARGAAREGGNISRMRQRFNELVDDAFSLFGSAGSSPRRTHSEESAGRADGSEQPHAPEIAQARNDNVRLPGSPYTALDTVRGRSANVRPTTSSVSFGAPPAEGAPAGRPRTSLPRHPALLERRAPPARAWDTPSPQPQTMSAGAVPRAPTVNPHLVLAEARLAPTDPALPLISAIKSEIRRVRDANMPAPSQARNS